MGVEKDSSRLKRIGESLADTAESGIIEVTQKVITVFISDAGSWVMNRYEQWKNRESGKEKPSNTKHKELQKYIDASNESIQIGMEKKEIAVMWAMIKLGYSDEEIQKVLDLANTAYLPKETR